MPLPSKLETIINNLGKLKTCVIRFVGISRKEPLKRGPRPAQTTETEIPDRFKNGITKVSLAFAKIGTDYLYEVNKIRESEGKSTTFRGKGKKISIHPISDNLVVWQHETTNQKYVRLYLKKDSLPISIYFDSNGVQITKEEYNEAERKYMDGWSSPEDKKASGQKTQGVDDPLIINQYKIEGILFIEVDGDVVLNELTPAQTQLLNK